MKAFFIFKDGKLIGNPIGYTTIKGAQKSLVGCQDWYRQMKPYPSVFEQRPPEEFIDSGIYTYSEYTKSWLFNKDVWTRKVWNQYVKEHYEIIEKEFDIVFKD